MSAQRQQGNIKLGDGERAPRLVLLREEWEALSTEEQEAIILKVPQGKRLLIVSD